ncbi:hypothetical protein BH09ACT1_BH09ACT1_06600 [soil metagenome]
MGIRSIHRQTISGAAIAAILAGLSGLAAGPAFAATPAFAAAGEVTDVPATVTADGISYPAANFSVDSSAKLITLTADYTTSAAVFIPQDYTLDGAGHTLFAADPATTPFLGAAVQNAAGTTNFAVTNLTIDGRTGLAKQNSTGQKNLFGVRFLNASGSVRNSTILGIARGTFTTTNEGVAVTANNLGGATARTVTVSHVTANQFQKSAVTFIGNVGGSIDHNTFGSGAAIIAPNTISLQTGASANILDNALASVAGTNGYSGSGMLLYGNAASLVRGNIITGSAQYAISALDVSGYPMGTTTVLGNTIVSASEVSASSGAAISTDSATGALLQRYNSVSGYAEPLRDARANGSLREIPVGVAQPVSISASGLTLHAEWAAATGASDLLPVVSYTVSIVSGSTIVGSTTTPGLSADFTVPAGSYTATVTPNDAYGSSAALTSSAVTAVESVIAPGAVPVTIPDAVTPVAETAVPTVAESVPVLADWIAADVGTDTADLLDRYASANNGAAPPKIDSFLTFTGLIPMAANGDFDASVPFTASAPWAGTIDSWVDVWAYSTPTFIGTFPVVDGILQISGADVSALASGSHHLVFVGQTSRTHQVVALTVAGSTAGTTAEPAEKPGKDSAPSAETAPSSGPAVHSWEIWLLVVVVVFVLAGVVVVTRFRRQHG